MAVGKRSLGKRILADLVDVGHNVTVLHHPEMDRGRVYPQVAGATITLISDGVADTFGPWTEIVPINTIDMIYKVLGLSIYGVDVASDYFIQLGYSIVGGSAPNTSQILGEREMRITDAPIAQATELLDFHCSACPANAKLWGRLKTDGGATDEAYITVVVARHIHVRGMLANLATWPWS